MKLNKTLMIAALVAGSMFAADVAVRAQDATNKPAAGARPPGGLRARGGMNFDGIATQLELSEDQKTKAKPVFDGMRQKMADLFKDHTLNQADRRAKIRQIRDEANAKLKEILTPEQYDKWMKMGPGNRRPPSAGAPPPAGGAKSPQ